MNMLNVLPSRHDEGKYVLAILKDWIGLDPEDQCDVDDERTNELESANMARLRNALPTMYNNLLGLHKCGIVVCDIAEWQWVEGILVDLSSSWTIPHINGPGGFAERPEWTFMSVAAWDLRCFQVEVIDRWNNIDWPRRTETHKLSQDTLKKCELQVYPMNEELSQRKLDQEGGKLQNENPGITHDNIGVWREDKLWLPLLNPYFDRLYFLTRPPHDPAKFDWKSLQSSKGNKSEMKTRKRKRSGGGDQAQGVINEE